MELKIDSAADQAILSAMREGHLREAAHLIVRYYGDAVYNLCAAQVPDLAIAEDLTQESFTRAFSSLSEFRGETSARSWLIRMARKCCLEHLRDNPSAEDERSPDMLATVQLDESMLEKLKISESLRRRLEVLASAL